MSCYVGDYYSKFEPSSREKKVARVDFLEASAGSSERITEFGCDPLEVEAFLRPAPQGGAAGVRGGCRPASCCVFISSGFRDMPACNDI